MPIALPIEISALYISLTALLALALAWKVVTHRLSKKVEIGDDGTQEMQTAIRCHANLIEWGPITLLLLLVNELLGFDPAFVHLMGAAFFLGRVAHAYGFFKSNGGSHPGRMYGILANWIVLVVLSVANILAVLGVL